MKLVTNGKGDMTVVKLQADELTMKVDTKEATPDDGMTLMMVYKVKGE